MSSMLKDFLLGGKNIHFENKVLRKIFGHMKDEVSGEFRI
jgi:hypothetical protein